MKDFLTFRKMISPILVQILFWLVIIFIIFTAIVDILQGVSYRIVFEILIIGPLVTRIICELLILFFRIQADVNQIKNYINK